MESLYLSIDGSTHALGDVACLDICIGRLLASHVSHAVRDTLHSHACAYLSVVGVHCRFKRHVFCHVKSKDITPPTALLVCSIPAVRHAGAAAECLQAASRAEQEANALKLYTFSMRLEMYVDQHIWQTLSR